MVDIKINKNGKNSLEAFGITKERAEIVIRAVLSDLAEIIMTEGKYSTNNVDFAEAAARHSGNLQEFALIMSIQSNLTEYFSEVVEEYLKVKGLLFPDFENPLNFLEYLIEVLGEENEENKEQFEKDLKDLRKDSAQKPKNVEVDEKLIVSLAAKVSVDFYEKMVGGILAVKTLLRLNS